MKLCTFEVRTHLGRHRRLGAVLTTGILDLNFAYAVKAGRQKLADAVIPANMREFLETEIAGMDAARETIAYFEQTGVRAGLNEETLLYSPEQVKLLTPLPDPNSLRDFFAFEAHVKKGFEKRGETIPKEWYEIPVSYKGAHRNLIGSGENVPWPSFTRRFDYELELAAIIGKKGRNVRSADAARYLAGFTVMNDFSARDIQKREMAVRLGPSKAKDWCTALGPYLVTPDEIGDYYNLRMTARVNGELWSEGNSSSMYWKFEQMIEFLTQDDTIYPGDVIGSGTVGTGCGLELDRWVQRGDVLDLEIEKIGVLTNRVV